MPLNRLFLQFLYRYYRFQTHSAHRGTIEIGESVTAYPRSTARSRILEAYRGCKEPGRAAFDSPSFNVMEQEQTHERIKSAEAKHFVPYHLRCSIIEADEHSGLREPGAGSIMGCAYHCHTAGDEIYRYSPTRKTHQPSGEK